MKKNCCFYVSNQINIVLAIIIKNILSSLIKKLWNPILINPQCGLIKITVSKFWLCIFINDWISKEDNH